MGAAAVGDDAAQHDARVHVAVKVEVRDAAGVMAARRRFEFVDQLHGAQFGRAGHGAGRERRRKQVERVAIVAQFAGDVRDDVHHVAVALDAHQFVNADAAGAADFAEVVAREVDEHHVLRRLLWVGEEVAGLFGVFGGRLAARPRSGQRPDPRRRAVEPHEKLRRRAEDRSLAVFNVEHVGRRVGGPQTAVEVERRSVERARVRDA